MRTLRLELTVLATLVVALTALVLALRGDSSPAAVAQDDVPADEAAVASDVPEGAATIDIVNFAYDPDPVRVQVGQPVAWTNYDGAPHTATASKPGEGTWDTGYLEFGETGVITFDEPGTYTYICTLHPPRQARFFGAPDGAILAGGGGHAGMQGTIIVE